MSRRIIDYLNGLAAETARPELTSCCGATVWVERMVTARPFPTDAALFERADRLWWSLKPNDWLEAFAQHPRIGERLSDPARQAGRGHWAREEQSGMASASAATRQALVEGNKAYEERFGYGFLLCATGLTADEMLIELQHRLPNDPGRELRIAAAEQAMITRLRLEKLIKE